MDPEKILRVLRTISFHIIILYLQILMTRELVIVLL